MDDSQHCIEAFLTGQEFGRDCASWLIEMAKRLARLDFRDRFRNQDLEDLAQDAVVSAWKSRKQFTHRSQFQTWFGGVVHYTGLMRLRKLRKSPVSISNDSLAVPFEKATHDTTQDEATVLLLLDAVNLSPTEERVLKLSMNGAGDQKAIGLELGMQENEVKMAARRARNKMKTIFSVIEKEASCDE